MSHAIDLVRRTHGSGPLWRGVRCSCGWSFIANGYSKRELERDHRAHVREAEAPPTPATDRECDLCDGVGHRFDEKGKFECAQCLGAKRVPIYEAITSACEWSAAPLDVLTKPPQDAPQAHRSPMDSKPTHLFIEGADDDYKPAAN